MKCHPSTIYQRLLHIDNTKQYIKHRALVFAALQDKIIHYITDAKLQKANLQQLTWSLGVLYDKERLESGLSTQNIAYADMIQAHSRDKERLEQLKKEI